MLEKILLAVDMSDHARKAVPAAAELARAGGGSVHVLHVRELHYPVPPTVVGDSPEEAQQLVDGVVAELEQAGVGADGVVRQITGGSPAAAILEQARETGAGMVVRPAAWQRRSQGHPALELPGAGGPRRGEPAPAPRRRPPGPDQVPGLTPPDARRRRTAR
jgi:nucleotide-binding universal stress UspA family protein